MHHLILIADDETVFHPTLKELLTHQINSSVLSLMKHWGMNRSVMCFIQDLLLSATAQKKMEKNPAEIYFPADTTLFS